MFFLFHDVLIVRTFIYFVDGEGEIFGFRLLKVIRYGSEGVTFWFREWVEFGVYMFSGGSSFNFLNIITDLGIHVPIEPEYNKLVLIDIKSSVKPHYINTIKCGNRLAITGWFI